MIQMDSCPTQIYEFGPYLLDSAERRLLRDGQIVPLTPKLLDLLLVLVRHSGHALSKDDLLHEVWSDAIVEENNLSVNISALRRLLDDDLEVPRYIETVPRFGYRFRAPVREVREKARCRGGKDEAGSGQRGLLDETPPSAPWRLEPVGGAVPLNSRFYLVRRADEEFRSAIGRQESIVLVKGVRQVGKTSLLARGLQQARQQQARVVLTDFQMLNAADLSTIETLFLTLAGWIAYQLDLETTPRLSWDALSSPNLNFERFWREQVLEHISSPVVWGMDEVDRLFSRPFASEFFGLLRSWHNARALDPESPWQDLTLAIAYATEAHLFVTDLNQSPFNVGTRILLEDFTLEQTADLNSRYGSPLGEPGEVERFFRLVGGNPYLVRRGLHEMAGRGITLEALEAEADRDDGPFGDHLRRLLASLAQDAALTEVVRAVLRDQGSPTAESFYRLRSAGVLSGDAARLARPRCALYASFLARHLL
jgi:DNA-binding winged helix-turn-helix (wHTH) protein